MARTRILAMLHCDLDLEDMTLGKGHWLRSTIVWNIIQIKVSSKKLSPRQEF